MYSIFVWFWYQCDTSWRFPPSAIFWKNLQMIAVSSSLDDKFAFEAIWSWNFVLWKLLNYGSGSDGKESACNAGDLGLIRKSGRSHGEGNGYPLQYSCLENSKAEESSLCIRWPRQLRSIESQRVGHVCVSNTFTFITCDIGLFIFSNSSWFSLRNCTFLGICPFLPGCPLYWHILACSIILWSLVFLQCHL